MIGTYPTIRRHAHAVREDTASSGRSTAPIVNVTGPSTARQQFVVPRVRAEGVSPGRGEQGPAQSFAELARLLGTLERPFEIAETQMKHGERPIATEDECAA